MDPVDALVDARRFEEALALLGPDSPRRQNVLQRWADVDGGSAARWASRQPGLAAEALPAIFDRWMHTDLRSAMAYAYNLPAGSLRQSALQEGASRWLAQEETGAVHWLLSQQPSPAWDRSLANHASSDELRRRAPEAALALARHISEPGLRAATLQALQEPLDSLDGAEPASASPRP